MSRHQAESLDGQGIAKEWLVVAGFLVFICGLAVVTTDAVKHAGKPSHDQARQGDALIV